MNIAKGNSFFIAKLTHSTSCRDQFSAWTHKELVHFLKIYFKPTCTRKWMELYTNTQRDTHTVGLHFNCMHEVFFSFSNNVWNYYSSLSWGKVNPHTWTYNLYCRQCRHWKCANIEVLSNDDFCPTPKWLKQRTNTQDNCKRKKKFDYYLIFTHINVQQCWHP